MDSPLSNRTRERGIAAYTPDRSSVLASSPSTTLNQETREDAGPETGPRDKPAGSLKARLLTAAEAASTQPNRKRVRADFGSELESPTVERGIRRRKIAPIAVTRPFPTVARETTLPTPPRSDPLSDARVPDSLGPPSVPSGPAVKHSRDWGNIPSSPTPLPRSAFKQPPPLLTRTPTRRRTPSPPRTPSLVPYTMEEVDSLRRAPGPNPFASSTSTRTSNKSAAFVTPAPRYVEGTPLRSTRDSTYAPSSPPSPTLQARVRRGRPTRLSLPPSDDEEDDDES